MSEGNLTAVNAAIVGERPTGLGVFALHVITALDRLGERLRVYTSRPDLVVAPRASVQRITAAVRPERGARGHLARLVWTQTALRRHLRRDDAACLINMVPEGLLRPPVPQITVLHDLLPLLYPDEYPRQQFYFRYLVPAVLRSSRAVIVSSGSTRRDLLHFYRRVPPERVHVALLGYDAEALQPDEAGEPLGLEPYALFVGNILPHKNLARLVDAFAAVARRLPVTLVIRGSARLQHVDALRRRIAALGVEPRIDWRPYAEAAELTRLYHHATMVLLPSLHEGFGLTALEAMACGAPVLASNTSSLPEVVGDAALTVDPTDTRAIAEGMERLFTDEQLRKNLSERGRSRARLFSWETSARMLQSLVHSLR